MSQIDHALEARAGARRPEQRGGIERQLLADLVEQGERILGLAIHLVDEGDDGNVAQSADLEQLQGLRLDALGGVQDHHGRIGCGQGAIGVLREVLVAGRVQQVEHQPGVIEGHNAGRNGDAALALDTHPVRTSAALFPPGAHGPGRADGPAGQQQVLGQCGLAGVRMTDDGERASPRRLERGW